MTKKTDLFQKIFRLRRDVELSWTDIFSLIVFHKRAIIILLLLCITIGLFIIIATPKVYKSVGVFVVEKRPFFSGSDVLGKWDYHEYIANSFYNDVLNSNISINGKDSLKLEEFISDEIGVNIKDASDKRLISNSRMEVIESLKKSCIIYVDEKFGTLRIEVALSNPEVSASVVQIIANTLSKNIIQNRIERKYYDYMNSHHSYLTADSNYYQALRIFNENYDKNYKLSSNLSRFSIDTLYIKKELAKQNYKTSWMKDKLSQMKYKAPERLLYEISPPTIPLKSSYPRKKIILINSILLGLWFGLLFSIINRKNTGLLINS